MSKPDWKNAPEWARYLSRDENGHWWWYEVEPSWREDEGKWWPQPDTQKIRCELWARQVSGNGTLERRP